MKLQKVLIYFVLIVVLINSYFLFFHNKDNIKIAYVDNMKVFQNYKGMENVKRLVDANNNKLKSSMDTLQADFENEFKKYEKGRNAMSDKEKQLSEQLLQNRQQQYMRYKEATEKKAKEEQLEITQRELKNLDDFMKKYAKSKGYDFIFGANSSANIIYANDVYNITDEIIKEANLQYEKQ